MKYPHHYFDVSIIIIFLLIFECITAWQSCLSKKTPKILCKAVTESVLNKQNNDFSIAKRQLIKNIPNILTISRTLAVPFFVATMAFEKV